MIVCAHELIACGYAQYWDDLNRFARNQLVENQVRYTGYVVCDNTKPDANGITYRDIDRRMLGGFTGGSEPNSISLTRFRSIAGCCVGTAPVALKTVWDDSVTSENGVLCVNIPFDRQTPQLCIRSFLPDEGRIELTAGVDCVAGVRRYDWIENAVLTVDGVRTQPCAHTDILCAPLKAGQTLAVTFPLHTREVRETVRGSLLRVFWRGCDVIDILPRGEHIRLYQRNHDIPKYYPLPEDVVYTGAVNMGPTQQK